MTESPYPWRRGTITWVLDSTADDSDKSWTVPTGKIWMIKEIYVNLVTSANVGNRVLGVSYSNGATVVSYVTSATNHAASTTYNYNWWPSANRQVAATPLTLPLPDAILLPGYILRVWDVAAIAVAIDDMTVAVHYIEYDA